MRVLPTDKTSIYCVGVMHKDSPMALLNITLQQCVGVANLNCIINTKQKKKVFLSPRLKEHC